MSRIYLTEGDVHQLQALALGEVDEVRIPNSDIGQAHIKNYKWGEAKRDVDPGIHLDREIVTHAKRGAIPEDEMELEDSPESTLVFVMRRK